jgi:hypothetical protein
MAITVNVVGAVVIIMTAVLADKVSEKWKKWCWALFVCLVLAQAGLQIKSQKEYDAKADRQDTDIQNLSAELRKSETGRQIDNAILKTKLEDYAQLAQLGPALMKLAQTSADFQRKQYESKVISDRELYRLTMDSVKKIRDFSAKYDSLESANFQAYYDKSMSEAERLRIWTAQTNKIIQLSDTKHHEFQTSILPDAIYARNELLRKRLAEPPLDPYHRATINMVLDGALAGVRPELEFATYLELMAKPLSPK